MKTIVIKLNTCCGEVKYEKLTLPAIGAIDSNLNIPFGK